MLKTVITLTAVLGLAAPAFASIHSDLAPSRSGAVEVAKKKVKKEEKKEESTDEAGKKTEEKIEKTEKKEPQR